MRTDQGEWILTEEEMAAVAAAFGLRNGALGVLPEKLPTAKFAEDTVRAFGALERPFQALAERCLKTLGDPQKLVRFHNTVTDDRVGRCLLAWHPDLGGAWGSLAKSGDLWRVSLRSETELRFLVADALSADDSLRPDRISVSLSTPEALALLAAFDHIRRARLISLLNHTEPVALFSAEDVQARLAEASVEDFRWTLPFLARLLPLPIGDLAVTKDPRPALLALERAGLLERLGTSGERVLCELTNAGAFLEAGFRESSARAALSVTVPLQGGVGHDVFLLVRSVFDLFFVSLSGGDAALSTILAGDLDEISKNIFAPPPPLPPPAVSGGETAGQGVEATVILNGPTLALACLVVDSGPLAGKIFTVTDGLGIGRQADNDIVINDPGVSRRHARFTRDGKGIWSVADLGSSNGCFVNEVRIESPTALQPGDHIRVSNTIMTFNPSGD
jgi:hypothetical protein